MRFLKYKYIIALALLSFAGILFGSLQKIMHRPNADIILKISYYSAIAAILLALIKLVFTQNRNLNK